MLGYRAQRIAFFQTHTRTHTHTHTHAYTITCSSQVTAAPTVYVHVDLGDPLGLGPAGDPAGVAAAVRALQGGQRQHAVEQDLGAALNDALLDGAGGVAVVLGDEREEEDQVCFETWQKGGDC